jgi:transposase
MECPDAPAERLEQVGGVLPGIERQPCKKLEPSDERLLGLLHRWRDEAVRAGKKITRIALAFEAGRDGFWLRAG